MEHVDPLLDCLVELTRVYARPATRSSLSAGLPIDKTGLTPSQFYRAADRAGFASRIAKIELQNIKTSLLPCILLLKENHACLLLRVDKKKKNATVLYPESGQGEVLISLEELKEQYTQRAIFARPRFRLDQRTPEVMSAKSRHWFWGAFMEQMPLYKDVLVAALLVNLFALAVPFFSMNVYDRVVPSGSRRHAY